MSGKIDFSALNDDMLKSDFDGLLQTYLKILDDRGNWIRVYLGLLAVPFAFTATLMTVQGLRPTFLWDGSAHGQVVFLVLFGCGLISLPLFNKIADGQMLYLKKARQINALRLVYMRNHLSDGEIRALEEEEQHPLPCNPTIPAFLDYKSATTRELGLFALLNSTYISAGFCVTTIGTLWGFWPCFGCGALLVVQMFTLHWLAYRSKAARFEDNLPKCLREF